MLGKARVHTKIGIATSPDEPILRQGAKTNRRVKFGQIVKLDFSIILKSNLNCPITIRLRISHHTIQYFDWIIQTIRAKNFEPWFDWNDRLNRATPFIRWLRVLMERVLPPGPHPWGVIVTFLLMVKREDFWTSDFVNCSQNVRKLIENFHDNFVSLPPKLAEPKIPLA